MPSNGKSVLVIEDDVNLQNSLLKMLTLQGFKTMGTTEMRDALFRLKNQKYDCVVMDIRLGSSESGGAELIQFARERKDSMNTRTPILVISGYLEKDLVQEIATYIQGALVKPFDSGSLVRLVRKLTGEPEKRA